MNDIPAEPAPTGTLFLTTQTASRGPLTFQQRFFWDYLNLKKGESLRDPFVFRVVGPLDSGLLTRSLNEVVRRYDCLHTRIAMTDGVLEQRVDEPVQLNLEVLDLVSLPQEDRETHVRKFISEFAERKCDLAVGPLVVTALIRMSTDQHVLALAVHHVIADATTIRIVLEEVWSVYGDLLEGKQAHLARTPVRYLDYAIWQHATHDDWLQKHERYWKDRIAGAPRVQWPADTCVPTDERADAWVELADMPRLADLRGLARSARTTPAMVVLTVYAAIVASWCRQKAFIIPVNIAGRHRPEHEYAAGYFAHFLYVGVETTDGETFLELLAKVSGMFREALMHQDFGTVATQVPDVLLGSMFSWVPWNRSTLGIPPSSTSNKLGIAIQQFPFARASVRQREFWGIAPFFWVAEGEYSAALWYCTDVFATSTVERFAFELRSLCERVVADPHCLAVEKRSG